MSWILYLSELEVDEHCKAGEIEKRKAVTAMHNIFSMLTHYSELTGRLVCAKKCSISVMSPLNASLNISLGRIKQSFVLWVGPNSQDSCFADDIILLYSLLM